MAQTTGLINATLIKMTAGGVQLTHLTNVNLSLSHSPRDATSKDSNGDEEVLEGQKSGEFTADYWDADDATYGFIDLHTTFTNRTAVAVVLGTNVVGDSDFTASKCYITSLTRGGGVEETATGSVSFKISGGGSVAVNT